MAFSFLLFRNTQKNCFLKVPLNSFRLFCQGMENSKLSEPKLSKHLYLLKADSFVQQNAPNRFSYEARPLVVLLTWLMAKRKHVNKYSEVYLKKGFDVLSVTINPWQFFWPTIGSQVVADELLKFLYLHSGTKPILLHGFSIGGYFWGEVLVKMNEDLEKYSSVINRIKGQIWDSAPDVSELNKGLPHAVVPNSPFLRSLLEKYVLFHSSIFYGISTYHYQQSSKMFHQTPVRAPVLIFISEDDPIATVKSNIGTQNSWENLGMKVFWKSWDKSKHVQHLILHREEYLETLNAYLEYINLTGYKESPLDKIQAKL